MKRLVSLLLCLALCLGLVPAMADNAPEKVIMTFLTTGVEPIALKDVQAALNEMTIRDLNIEIEFKPVSIFTAPSQYGMWIGAREPMDIMFIAFTDIKPFIDQGMVEPLDDLIDAYAPYLKQLSETTPLLRKDADGNTYGLATLLSPFYRGGGVLMRVEHLEAAGLADQYHDMDKITLDDLDTIYAAIKAALPDVYPAGVFGSLPPASYTFIYDTLGDSTASGALIGTDSTEVVNYYTSDEYVNYLKHVRSWYENGYVMKDAATNEANLSELSRAGTISSNFTEGSQVLLNGANINYGAQYIRLMINDYYLPAVSSGELNHAAISVTAQNPEGAIKVLNYLYQSKEAINLLVYGIEGTHWVFTDKENEVIYYPDGVDVSNSTYAYGYGLYGDQSLYYSFGSTTKKEDTEVTAAAWANRTKGYGFMFDSAAYTNQLIAIQSVIDEYVPALETGSADLERTYAEFISKLEANGINEMVAAKQAQFNTWLADQE